MRPLQAARFISRQKNCIMVGRRSLTHTGDGAGGSGEREGPGGCRARGGGKGNTRRFCG